MRLLSAHGRNYYSHKYSVRRCHGRDPEADRHRDIYGDRDPEGNAEPDESRAGRRSARRGTPGRLSAHAVRPEGRGAGRGRPRAHEELPRYLQGAGEVRREPNWIDKRALLLLHEESLATFGGARGLRDEGLLDSALARPVNKF